MFGIGATEILVIAGLLLLITPAEKVPEIARKLGDLRRQFTQAAQAAKRELDAVTHPIDEKPGEQDHGARNP